MKHFNIVFTIATFLMLGGCQTQRAKSIKEGFANVNDVQLYYKIIGEGEPIVVLHGGPGFDHNHMLPFVELANDYKVIFYDQRATGNSTGNVDVNSITVDNFVEDLEGLRKKLNLGRVTLVGHSWGAMLAMFLNHLIAVYLGSRFLSRLNPRYLRLGTAVLFCLVGLLIIVWEVVPLIFS